MSANEPRRPSYNPQVLKGKREAHTNVLRAALKKALGFGTYHIVNNDGTKRLKGGGQ